MKKRIWLGMFFVMVFFLLANRFNHEVYAVPGEINNLLQPTQAPIIYQNVPVVTPDTRLLDECNNKLKEATTSLKNCQDANVLMKAANDKSNADRNMFMLLSAVTGGIAVLLTIALIVLLLTRKKSPPPQPPGIAPAV